MVKVICSIITTSVAVLGLIAYKAIQLVLPYIYKIVCKNCNIVKKYKDVHTKANVKDVTFETDLHR